MKPEEFTEELRLEAAMVLWEAVNDSSSEMIDAYRQCVGTAQLRNDIMPFLIFLHEGWHAHEASGNAIVGFDWEFTPWFVENCLVFDVKDGVRLVYCWKRRCTELGS